MWGARLGPNPQVENPCSIVLSNFRWLIIFSIKHSNSTANSLALTQHGAKQAVIHVENDHMSFLFLVFSGSWPSHFGRKNGSFFDFKTFQKSSPLVLYLCAKVYCLYLGFVLVVLDLKGTFVSQYDLGVFCIPFMCFIIGLDEGDTV